MAPDADKLRNRRVTVQGTTEESDPGEEKVATLKAPQNVVLTFFIFVSSKRHKLKTGQSSIVRFKLAIFSRRLPFETTTKHQPCLSSILQAVTSSRTSPIRRLRDCELLLRTMRLTLMLER